MVCGGTLRQVNYEKNKTIIYSQFDLLSGIIYDVIVEPPSIGSTTDERGHSRPVLELLISF